MKKQNGVLKDILRLTAVVLLLVFLTSLFNNILPNWKQVVWNLAVSLLVFGAKIFAPYPGAIYVSVMIIVSSTIVMTIVVVVTIWQKIMSLQVRPMIVVLILPLILLIGTFSVEVPQRQAITAQTNEVRETGLYYFQNSDAKFSPLTCANVNLQEMDAYRYVDLGFLNGEAFTANLGSTKKDIYWRVQYNLDDHYDLNTLPNCHSMTILAGRSLSEPPTLVYTVLNKGNTLWVKNEEISFQKKLWVYNLVYNGWKFYIVGFFKFMRFALKSSDLRWIPILVFLLSVVIPGTLAIKKSEYPDVKK